MVKLLSSRQIRNIKRDWLHKGLMFNKPKIFVNSIQKAGTHFLKESLTMGCSCKSYNRGIYKHTLNYMMKDSQLNISENDVVNKIRTKSLPGEVWGGHLEYSEAINHELDVNKFNKFLIVRNPFDVVVSLANWWERHDEVPTEPYLHYKKLNSFEAKLEFLLYGGKTEKYVWPSLDQRYKLYHGWLTDKNTLVVKYEDLKKSPDLIYSQIVEKFNLPINRELFLKGSEPQFSKTFTTENQKQIKKIPEGMLNDFLRSSDLNAFSAFGYNFSA